VRNLAPGLGHEISYSAFTAPRALINNFDFSMLQEEAAVEFVNQIGDHAQAQLEDEWAKKAETLMAEMTQQISVAGEPTAYKADLPIASSLPQESSQEPLVASKSTTSVVETRVTPPEV
jgi:hypothetical protein